MEETKIWAVEGTSATPLNTTDQVESEGLLENILTANPDMLEDGLQLVGRQTSTAGGPLDLLGVDTDGRLVVYELKRGTLNRDAVAQVIDYASSLNAMDEDALYRHISGRSGNLGIGRIDNFGDWYGDNWSEEGFQSLMPPRMVLVGMGVDNTTERMVSYMAEVGMDISLLTFYGFVNGDGRTLLARNIEVDSERVTVTPSWRTGSRNRRSRFEERASDIGLLDVLNCAREMLRNHFDYKYHDASRNRMRFNRDSVSYFFIEIDEDQKCLKIGFYPRAVDLALAGFDKFLNSKEGKAFSKISAGYAKKTEQVDYAVALQLKSLEDWNTHKRQITELTQAVYEAYQKEQLE